MISIRDYVYLGAIAIIVAALLWWHHSGVLAGEAKVHAAEAKATAAQVLADSRVSKETVDGLKSELDKVRKDALQPVPIPAVRVCVSPRPSAPPAAAAGTAAEPAPGWSVPAVPAGTGSGPDLGPGLRQLALAADIVSARDRACLAWAHGIAK